MSDENPEDQRGGLTGRVRRAVRSLVPSLGTTDERERAAPSPETDTDTMPVGDPGRPTPTPPTIADEERVLRYLRPHGGRMRQWELVECTEWSKSKMSRLLSDMEAEGSINRTQIGREKIVALPGHEPEATQSPFDASEGVSDDARARSK
jgi:hypothetical protein